MTRLLLVRHAENDWVRTGRLAGRTPDVHLNDEGRRQAAALGERLSASRLEAVYSSPLERALETAQAVLEHHPALTLQIEEGVSEVEFGEWTGQSLRQLARRRLWRVVQGHPSGARFPCGESFHEVQRRAVSALERIAQRHPAGTVVIVSHADVLKTVIAHYAGIHLDLFQRLVISPASLSVVTLGRLGPHVMLVNDTSHYDGQRRTDRQG